MALTAYISHSAQYTQARLVLEEPDSVGRILEDWQTVLAETLQKWGVKQQDLQAFFEDFRNNLLKNKEVPFASSCLCTAIC